jgi:hypothetical protein
MRILLLDTNHPLIEQQLSGKGFVFDADYTSSYDEVLKKSGITKESSSGAEFHWIRIF